MLAVHGGVGENQVGVDKLCADAVRVTRRDVVKAVMFLENDGITNCGVGSSLTINQTVECEAGFMQSEGMAFGSVGALTISKHPSMLAKKLALAQLKDSKLMQPNCLVGNGADSFALSFALESEDVPTCSNSDLITVRSKRGYNKTKTKLEKPCWNICDIIGRWDTVGACSIKRSGSSSACVSSGGLIFKHPGRLGHSVVFGAGIWAEQRSDSSVSISLTGCGEAIVRTHLAERISECIFERDREVPLLETLTNCIRSRFLESRLLINFPEHRRKVGGLIVVKEGNIFELISFHNEKHFPFAFFDGVKIRRRLSKLQEGQSIVFDSVVFKL